MDQKGYCTICPGKCHYVAHTNSHTIRKVRNIKKKITKQDQKKKFMTAQTNTNLYQNSVKQKIKQYDESLIKTQDSLKYMTDLQQQLQKLSLSKSKPLSTRNYILFLIQNEKRDQKAGYLKRIEALNQNFLQLQIEQKILKGESLDKIHERQHQILENIGSDPRAKKSKFFKKLLQYFKW